MKQSPGLILTQSDLTNFYVVSQPGEVPKSGVWGLTSGKWRFANTGAENCIREIKEEGLVV